MINNNYVLRHNNNTSDIFVGVDAGNGTMSGHSNTLVGNSTGTSLTSGLQNTYVGYQSGKSTTTGYDNTILGYTAGESTTTGIENCFIGSYAGHDNVGGSSNVFIGFKAGYKNYGSTANTGSWNTIVGFHAGENDSIGNANCYYGKYSGDRNKTGNGNSYYGSHSGQYTGDTSATNNYNCMFGNFAGRNFISGNENIFIGYNAQNAGIPSDPWNNNISNSIAIGSNTLALASNKFILGNNSQKVGIGLSDDIFFNGPRSKLEINSDPTTTEDGQSTGSGLQFRQLYGSSILDYDYTYVNPYGLVLTVDEEGKVKLTDGGGLAYNSCSADSLPTLKSDMGLKLNDKRIFYDGNDFTTGINNDVPNSIGLGYACGNPLKGKLSVYQKATINDGEETAAGYFHNESEDVSGSAFNYKRGIWAISNGYSGAQFNIAGDFSADSSSTVNIAVQGNAGSQANDLFTSSNVGGQFSADYAYENIGINAWVGGNGGRNFALQLNAPMGACTTGTCTDGAAYVNGDIYQAGGSYYTTSDRSLKENIQPLQNALTVIKSLEPKSYNFRTNEFPYLSLSTGTQDGLIAQDVESILPGLVKMYSVPSRTTRAGIDSSGAGQSFRSINYIGLIPYLIGAIKQQQESIDSLRNQIVDVQSQINNCCHSNERGSRTNDSGNENNESQSNINVELSDVQTIILDQNSPNPFSEETYINYTIPETVSKAAIVIYNNLGQVLKTVVINERGEGVLHIFAERLSSGIYTYSLLADGKTIDSKKMVFKK